ncbi:MAG: hypothetical protein ACLQQB_02220 [Solirubrobacteraceae bacterium]
MSNPSEHRPRTSVSDEKSGEGSGDGPGGGSGVLAGLPRTRPQRASARRVASRAANAAKASTAPARQTKKRSRTKSPRPVDEPVPKQGYEAEPESLNGPVHPPGGTELLASAAELAGELTKSGVNSGVRVLRDFLSRLPG